MDENRLHYLIKIGSENNIKDLYDNGTIYFNTIEYFRILENDIDRGDNYEGTTEIQNYFKEDEPKLQLTFNDTGKTLKFDVNNLHIREFMKDIKGNMYCMSFIDTNDLRDYETFRFDKRIKGFGSHFLIIHNVVEFFDRLKSELQKQGGSIKGDVVRYYDKNKKKGKVSIFEKRNEFEYQKEYRIVWSNEDFEVKRIHLGPLHNISKMFSATELDELRIGPIDK